MNDFPDAPIRIIVSRLNVQKVNIAGENLKSPPDKICLECIFYTKELNFVSECRSNTSSHFSYSQCRLMSLWFIYQSINKS